jgi:SAM-dependent methyltransferase
MEGEYSGVDILEALESARNYNDYLVNLVRQSTPSKELIDFGAGIGTFSKRLRDSGYRVACIEKDPSLRQRLAQQDLAVSRDIESVPDASAAFIFSLNVFEHIKDDAHVVRQIARKLKPGGKLLLYVPAFQCLWSSFDENVGHCRRYTKNALRVLTEGAGLSVERLQYVDSLGFFVVWLFRFLKGEPLTVTTTSIRFYDRLIFPPSQIVDLAMHRFFGKNVFVLCRK